MVYEPQEDSFLLKKAVEQYARGKVLEIGTGSGILALAAANLKNTKSVLAVDIDIEALNYAKQHSARKKITFIQSDLFNKIRGKFDTIIFNPPYLPQEGHKRDIQLEGGKQGYEVIEKFIISANEHLTENGEILLLFSSFSKQKEINYFLDRQLFSYKEIEKQHVFFEDLIVYQIIKSNIRKQLEKMCKDLTYFARGRRGFIYTGAYKNKKVAIKIKRKDTKVNITVSNEARFLKLANKIKIGPKFIKELDEAIIYEFVEGKYLKDIIDTANKKTKINLLTQYLKQALALDKSNIAKYEMQRPMKNALVNKKGKIVLIDFERARRTTNTHNTAQALQFIGKYVGKEQSRMLGKEFAKADNEKQLIANFNKLAESI